MIEYGRTRSIDLPPEMEITETKVFVASNITEFEETFEEQTVSGYEFDYVEYDKDEFINLLNDKNTTLEEDVVNTQLALCEVYELLEGGLMDG